MRQKRQYRKRQYPAKKINKTKKLVTGQGPTLLERLADQSNNIGLVAKSILPIAMAINTEHKYIDIALGTAAYAPGTNDSLTLISGTIAQGTTDQTRVGNSVLLKNINFHANVYWTPSATVTTNMVRIVLLVWKENLQDNPPTVAKILETPSNISSRFNKDYTDQMVILKDKYIGMQSPLANTNPANQIHVKFFKKLDFHARWDGSTVNDGTVNHIFCLIQGSNPLVANQSTVSYYARVDYTDN